MPFVGYMVVYAVETCLPQDRSSWDWIFLCHLRALIGTRRLYDFCHRNKGVRMHPLSHTHNLAVLSRLSRFVSLNSAVEVDLTGQVNAGPSFLAL